MKRRGSSQQWLSGTPSRATSSGDGWTRCNFRSRGFSLLEIMLVLVIVGIVAALAVPAMNAAFATYEVRQAAERVRTRILEARRRAVERGVPYAFVYVNGGAEHGFAACQSLADALTLSGAATTLSDAIARNPYDVHLFALEEGFRIVTGTAEQGSAGAESWSGDPLILMLTPDPKLASTVGTPFLAEVVRQTGLNERGTVEGLVWNPDGTTLSYDLTVISPAGFATTIHVSGNTGATRLSEVFKVETDAVTTSPGQRLPQFDRRIR